MNKIKSIVLDQTNWIEVIWVFFDNENNSEIIIRKESFGDSEEYINLLNQRCLEFETPLNEEHLTIINEMLRKRHIPTPEEIEEIERQRLIQERQLKLSVFNEAWDNVKIGYSPTEKVAFQIKYGKEISETLEQNLLYNIETETPTLINSSIHLYKTDKETINILTSKVTSKYEPTDSEFWYGSLGIYPLNMLEVEVILEKANKIIQSLADNTLGVSE